MPTAKFHWLVHINYMPPTEPCSSMKVPASINILHVAGGYKVLKPSQSLSITIINNDA